MTSETIRSDLVGCQRALAIRPSPGHGSGLIRQRSRTWTTPADARPRLTPGCSELRRYGCSLPSRRRPRETPSAAGKPRSSKSKDASPCPVHGLGVSLITHPTLTRRSWTDADTAQPACPTRRPRGRQPGRPGEHGDRRLHQGPHPGVSVPLRPSGRVQPHAPIRRGDCGQPAARRGSDRADQPVLRLGGGPVRPATLHRSGDLVVLVGIERQHGQVGGLPDQDWSLRVTLVYRRATGGWELLHRHADPLVRPIPFEHCAELARGRDV